MLTVSLMLPLPLAVNPDAPPAPTAVNVALWIAGGNDVGDRRADDAARPAVADHDRVGGRAARHGAGDTIGLGDRQVGLPRQHVAVGRRIVSRVGVGHAARRRDGRRVDQVAAGAAVDVGDDRVGDRAARGHVDRVVDVAAANGREARGAAGGDRGVRVAGDRSGHDVGDRCADDVARPVIADHDRVDGRRARHDADDAVGLGDREVGLRCQRIGVRRRVVGEVGVDHRARHDDRRRVRDRAGGIGRDRRRHRVRRSAVQQQRDQLVDRAAAVRIAARRARGRHACPAGERHARRRRVREARARDGLRSVVPRDDRVRGGRSRDHVHDAVGLGHLQVGAARGGERGQRRKRIAHALRRGKDARRQRIDEVSAGVGDDADGDGARRVGRDAPVRDRDRRCAWRRGKHAAAGVRRSRVRRYRRNDHADRQQVGERSGRQRQRVGTGVEDVDRHSRHAADQHRSGAERLVQRDVRHYARDGRRRRRRVDEALGCRRARRCRYRVCGGAGAGRGRDVDRDRARRGACGQAIRRRARRPPCR